MKLELTAESSPFSCYMTDKIFYLEEERIVSENIDIEAQDAFVAGVESSNNIPSVDKNDELLHIACGKLKALAIASRALERINLLYSEAKRTFKT